MEALGAVNDLGIGIRVKMLAVIAVGGLLLFAGMAFLTIEEVRAGSPTFAENRIALSLIADFVTPSQSLLQAENFLHRFRVARSDADIEVAKSKVRSSRAELEAGHKKYLAEIPAGHLRDLVTRDAYNSAEQWYSTLETGYLPLIERHDLEQAERFRNEKLDPLVVANVAACDEIGRLAGLWVIANREYVDRTVWSRRWQLAFMGLATLSIQLVLGYVIDKRVAQSTRRLQITLEELQRKNREVESFVYVVSHDLRGPLVNVQGFTHELEDSCSQLRKVLQSCLAGEQCWPELQPILEEDIPGALHFLSASTGKFERLIAALLDLSRKGRQIYKPERINVSELVENTVADFKLMIDETGADVVVGELPTVVADPTALGQVFANLIGNALKYRSPERELKVEVGGQEERACIHYWIRDNGLGIPEFGKERLFQVFQRLHPELAQGEGMGLAIAHRIVERHEGKIWVESKVGIGSIFHFSLPDTPTLAPSEAGQCAEGRFL